LRLATLLNAVWDLQGLKLVLVFPVVSK
jgi:hypothetical protein